jgi:hypothetical protein
MRLENRAAFYSVCAGDSLSRIQALGGSQTIWEANPHLSPNRCFSPGDLILLPQTTSFRTDPYIAKNLPEAAVIWRSMPEGTKKILLENFDLIDKITDYAEFGERLPTHSLKWVQRLPQMTAHVTEITETLTTLLSEQLFVYRNDTIQILNRLQISTRTRSVFLIGYRPNGFYGLSTKLKKMISVAEKIRLGKVIFWVDVGLQTGKVAVVVASGAPVREVLLQTARGVGNIFGGSITMGGASVLCVATIELGPLGWAACGGAVALAAFYGSEGGERLFERGFHRGESVYENHVKRMLPRLP